MPATKEELEEFLEEMREYKARHTELITVYVPAGFSINLITKQLESEKSTCTNIKSTTTRKNVQDALESLIRVTKGMKKTPKNGVVLFAGNVSKTEGQEDFITEAFEPPEELSVRLYRCDQIFVLEPLEEMLEIKELYGLVVIDRKEAALGLLIGKKIKVLQKFDSFVPGKTHKGGQCLSSDTIVETKAGPKRIFDIKIGDELKAIDIDSKKIIFTKCLNKWKKEKEKYLQLIVKDCWSIVSSEDHTFFKADDDKITEIAAKDLSIGDSLITYYDNELSELDIKKIISINKEIEMVDIETDSGNFFANGIIVHNSAQRFGRIREGIAKEFFRKVAEAMKKQFFNMENLQGILVGGPGPTKEDFLKEGNLVTALQEKVLGVKDIGYADEHGLDLLVETSGDILAEQEITYEKKLLEKFFDMLGKQKDKTAYGVKEVEKALSFGAVDTILLSKKLKKEDIKKFEKKAGETGVKIELISMDTEEGQQFWNLSGIGAMLRFKIG